MRAAATAVLWTVPTACLISVALIRSRYLVVTVEGSSMLPTLANGDRVLVQRTRLAAISAGRLVVTEPPTSGRWGAIRPSRWLIKRAAAVPGDPLPRAGAPALRDLPEKRVPQGRLVLLGDNPEESLDSRFCGYFRDEQIIGVVIRRLPRAEPHPGPAVTAWPSLAIRKSETSWTM
ncbi:S26 family signal peptidase [Streptomyces sp. NPDC056921]|uniref:S26 family signal peptidase n=1 Tax=Streptomyces sp. NPDC056921 TaxID=3345966 RepID=UPI00363A8D25